MMKASACRAGYTAKCTSSTSVWNCLEEGNRTWRTMANLKYLEDFVQCFCHNDWKLILGDAQTSGGLLLSASGRKQRGTFKQALAVNPVRK